ncbi:hypothetical protein Y032_0089g2215 [Ancylostoma ceylanicum]|uniref:Secreted protein n=1 Tax=Ancylostoma ceylanicum TaxID=53326 RepID=A0A016TN35_9BILA|nr:hypothetical protein Y032_0089g2215 [Ancylostoma ceylanicum]
MFNQRYSRFKAGFALLILLRHIALSCERIGMDPSQLEVGTDEMSLGLWWSLLQNYSCFRVAKRRCEDICEGYLPSLLWTCSYRALSKGRKNRCNP